jgi:hypothetical protein
MGGELAEWGKRRILQSSGDTDSQIAFQSRGRSQPFNEQKKSANFQLADDNVSKPVANVTLRSLPCRLLSGFGGETLDNFQLVDHNLRLPSANVEKHRYNVNKSVGNATESSRAGPLPDEDPKKQEREGPTFPPPGSAPG